MRIIGIDPGLSGAIAILEDNKIQDVFEMPTMSEGKKNKRQLNSAHLVKLLKNNINKSIGFYVCRRQKRILHRKISLGTASEVWKPKIRPQNCKKVIFSALFSVKILFSGKPLRC